MSVILILVYGRQVVDTYWSEVLDALSLQNSSLAFLKVYFLAITSISR